MDFRLSVYFHHTLRAFASYLSFVFLFIVLNNYSQQTFDFTVPPKEGIRLRAQIINGDTLPIVDLNTVYIYGDFIYKNASHYEQWTRIKYNVKKVYPYAILASAKLKEYDKVLEKITDNRMKKVFVRSCERELRAEFEVELKSLTVSQGKLLMKLIDRETGKTTYEIVKQMHGGFQASMFQAVAKVFGHNLKSEYDPINEDFMIERAIKVVEAGFF